MLPWNHAARTALLLVLVATAATSQSGRAAPDRRVLDWSASRRWVHIDNVDPAKVQAFENARRGWLDALRTKDGMLDDVRPLFWEGRGDDARTFFTFYPFANFAELDARRETALATNQLAGKQAVERYDEGDAALVAPHLSQIWRRSPSLDYVPPGAADLTELNALAGRIEFQEEDLQREEKTRAVWKVVRDCLASRRHPIACRTFWSEFGSGELVRIWLAPDARTLREAPSLDSEVRAAPVEVRVKTEVTPELVAQFVAVKRGEWERFATAVTDWELREYGKLF